MQLMVEQERRNVDKLRQELATTASAAAFEPPASASRKKKQNELDSAIRRLSKMQEQLAALKDVDGEKVHEAT